VNNGCSVNRRTLSFSLGKNTKTGESQWQARGKDDGVVVLYVVSSNSEKVPSADEKRWVCDVFTPIFVSDDCLFRIVPVIPIYPNPEERRILFLLGEREGKPSWHSYFKEEDGSTTMYVVDRYSENKPDPECPFWVCDVSEFCVFESDDGRFRIVPVTPKTRIHIPTRVLDFQEEERGSDRSRLVSRFELDGVQWTACVDFSCADRVRSNLKWPWTCVKDKTIWQSGDGLRRTVTVIPIAPKLPSERSKRRSERKLETRAQKQARVEAEREEAKKRSVEHNARNARAAGTSKSANRKKDKQTA